MAGARLGQQRVLKPRVPDGARTVFRVQPTKTTQPGNYLCGVARLCSIAVYYLGLGALSAIEACSGRDARCPSELEQACSSSDPTDVRPDEHSLSTGIEPVIEPAAIVSIREPRLATTKYLGSTVADDPTTAAAMNPVPAADGRDSLSAPDPPVHRASRATDQESAAAAAEPACE